MSRVSERVSGASPPEWGDRAVRSLALEALALLQASQSGASSRLDQRDAPSLAIEYRIATGTANTVSKSKANGKDLRASEQ